MASSPLKKAKKIDPADAEIWMSEIEAAIHLKMSPELLEFFATKAPKSGETRKLPRTEADGVVRYRRDDLDAFNSYLDEQWPKPAKAQRPHLPRKLKLEIKLEAHCGCAICGHSANGEAAHIEPVADTMSHHPKRLIWLCPNHHTEYDLGFKPRDVDLETVKAVKVMLVNRRLRLWGMERKASQDILRLLAQVEDARSFLGHSNWNEAHGYVSALVETDLAELQKVAKKAAKPKSPKGKKPPSGEIIAYAKFAQSILNAPTTGGSAAEKAANLLGETAEARAEFLRETGGVDCPVCDGTGDRKGLECRACGGVGTLSEWDAGQLRVSDFEFVSCPLCKGSGNYKTDPCPECNEAGEMERQDADQVVLSDYGDVDCPLCKGRGRYEGDDCPECAGECQLERHQAERIDLRQYEKVKCPLCDGGGQRHGDDCPPCRGEGRMTRQDADQLDIREYDDVDCRLCEGSGTFTGDDCLACGGRGSFERHQADQIDWNDFKLVPCPACSGRTQRNGDDCRVCDGEGTMMRFHADRLS
jgi:DnaJ-class molecular chaperone